MFGGGGEDVQGQPRRVRVIDSDEFDAGTLMSQ
jgi:hypothetical protein